MVRRSFSYVFELKYKKKILCLHGAVRLHSNMGTRDDWRLPLCQ